MLHGQLLQYGQLLRKHVTSQFKLIAHTLLYNQATVAIIIIIIITNVARTHHPSVPLTIASL